MLSHQYSNATNFNHLLYGEHIENPEYDGILDYINIDVEEFRKNYFDIDTANTEGLDNWGRILSFNRNILIDDDLQTLGFEGAQQVPPEGDVDLVYPQNFYNANFYGGQTKITTVNDEQFRLLLKFRYKVLNTNVSLASISRIMNSYFQAQNPLHKVQIEESDIMEITLVFNFLPAEFERYTFSRREFMPVPAGVDYGLLYPQN